MAHTNARLQHRNRQLRQPVMRCAGLALGRAVVSVGVQQYAVAAKRTFRRLLHCGSLGAAAGGEQQVESGTNFEQQERMTAPGLWQNYPVTSHLPNCAVQYAMCLPDRRGHPTERIQTP